MDKRLKPTSINFKKRLWIMLVIGLGLRIVLNHLASYSFDFHAFVMWAKYLTTHSIAQLFEFLPEGYTPYPPIYYYVLKFIGILVDIFGLWKYERLSYFIVKTPVFLADMIVTWLIYNFSKKHLLEKQAFIAGAFYYLHPAIIYNTSVWGQIDSIIILLTLSAVLLLAKNKIFLGLGIYLLSVLTKLQSLALLPLVIYLSLTRTSLKQLFKYGMFLGIIGTLPFLPVYLAKGFGWTWDYFFTIPNWYAYTSIYAYNLWAPFGFVISDNNRLLNLIEIKYAGILLFWLAAFIILLPFIRNKKNVTPVNLIFAAFLLWYDFSYFATRIHSRYLIYSFGFFAPFFAQFPKLGILLSILMVANFLLPNKNPILSSLVYVLNQPAVVAVFTIYGFLLFLGLYQAYVKKLSSH